MEHMETIYFKIEVKGKHRHQRKKKEQKQKQMVFALLRFNAG